MFSNNNMKKGNTTNNSSVENMVGNGTVLNGDIQSESATLELMEH